MVSDNLGYIFLPSIIKNGLRWQAFVHSIARELDRLHYLSTVILFQLSIDDTNAKSELWCQSLLKN